MSKIKKFFILFFLIIPVVILAKTFSNSEINNVNTFYNKFLTPSRYLEVERTMPFGLENGKTKNYGNFKTGGLLNKEEFDLTKKDNRNASSYLYDGRKFYLIDGKVVGETITNDGKAEFKITEYVKHETRVTGNGKYKTPWMFVDRYNVKVNAIEHGLVEDKKSYSLQVKEFDDAIFNISADTEYKYLNNDCGGNTTYSNGKLTISRVEKDIECNVYFTESPNSYYLEQPVKTVTSQAMGKTLTYYFPQQTKPPVPQNFYAIKNKGFYKDDTVTTRLGLLTFTPYRKGWNFYGYYVNDKQFITSNGIFVQNSYAYFDKGAPITYKVEPKEYDVKLNHGSGEIMGGQNSVHVKYEHDVPTIKDENGVKNVPGKKGYTLVGYNYEGKQFLKYDEGSNTLKPASNVWVMNDDKQTNPTLTAEWKECPVGSYCPGDNKEHKCPSGYSTAGTGSKSCKDCRYWDPCHDGQNTCEWGCDTYCYNYSYGCGQFCHYGFAEHNFTGTEFHCWPKTCYGTACEQVNCSSCHTGRNTCVGAWVHLSNENSCATVDSEKYTVNLVQGEGLKSEGTKSYELAYYGAKAVVTINNDKKETKIVLPQKNGYVFDGYYTSATGGTKVIDVTYVYSSGYDKTRKDYTPTEYNNFITDIYGSIVVVDIRKSTCNSATKTCTLYAHWNKCKKGSRCPGDNKQWNCEPGQYQDEEGKTSCKTCVVKSYQENYGEDKCTPCEGGLINENNGSTSCEVKCSNNTPNVSDWVAAKWNNNNTVSDTCKIKSCKTGYRLENNNCVQNKVTIKFKLADGATLKPSTSNSDGSYTWTTDSNAFIYKNGKLLKHELTYGSSLSETGLVNYNNSSYLNISRTGYTAVSGSEWVNDNNSSKKYNQNTQYKDSDFCDISENSCEVVLKVNWKIVSYTIEYETNGGSISGTPSTSYTIESASYTLPAPTRSGYIFMGWYTDSSFTGNSVTSIPTGSTGNKKFYAKWKINEVAGSSSNRIQTGSCAGKCYKILFTEITSVKCNGTAGGKMTCRFNTKTEKTGGKNAWANQMYVKIIDPSGTEVGSLDDCEIKPYTDDYGQDYDPWYDHCDVTFNVTNSGTYKYRAIVNNHGCIKDGDFMSFGWDNCNEMTGTIPIE